jgi:hypothetical protein
VGNGAQRLYRIELEEMLSQIGGNKESDYWLLEGESRGEGRGRGGL